MTDTAAIAIFICYVAIGLVVLYQVVQIRFDLWAAFYFLLMWAIWPIVLAIDIAEDLVKTKRPTVAGENYHSAAGLMPVQEICPRCHGFDDYCADVDICETCKGSGHVKRPANPGA